MNSYPRHRTRKVHTLDGIWQFAFLADADPEKIDIANIDCDDAMAVPAAFDATPAYRGQRGLALYRTMVPVTPGRRGRLRFGGMGMWARIFVDGARLADRALPYSGFTVDVPAARHEECEVALLVDNRFNSERVPLQEEYFDFYAYGGIFRGVEFHELPETALDRATITVRDLQSGTVTVRAGLLGNIPATVDLEAYIDGAGPVNLTSQPVKDGVVEFELRVPDPITWSPENPALHILRLVLGGDDIIERFGLRTVEARGRQLLLNGEPIVLKGFCRHEAHPDFGPALPLPQLVADIHLLREMGCNFVRGSHYPLDQRFLDLCDEAGLLVWEESLGWQQDARHFENDRYFSDCVEQTRLMVRNSFNHPAVITWAFLNEGHSEKQESRPLYAALAAAIREEDQTRPVSFACNRVGQGELNLDLVDVIGINCYPGWYAADPSPRPLDEIPERFDRLEKQLAELGQDGKPLLITEIGAGALYGWRDPHAGFWSEEYQRDLLRRVCEEIKARPAISGVALWQFCDCRTYPGAAAMRRPRTFNNKGIVDEYRRPKAAFSAVRECFRDWT